jgi:hypothetical protein
MATQTATVENFPRKFVVSFFGSVALGGVASVVAVLGCAALGLDQLTTHLVVGCAYGTVFGLSLGSSLASK